MNTKDVEKLIALIEDTDIDEIEYQSKDDKIRISRRPKQLTNTIQAETPIVQATTNTIVSESNITPLESNAMKAKNLLEVTSPFVGTFYRAPAPGADPFIKEGQEVTPGDTLCIVEAMKLMNEIEAEHNGVIKKILIENAKPVEYGEVLFLLEPRS